MTAARAQWPAAAALLARLRGARAAGRVHPLLALGAALAAVFATLVAADLTVGLCVFIVVAFAERIPAAGASDLTLVKALGGAAGRVVAGERRHAAGRASASSSPRTR